MNLVVPLKPLTVAKSRLAGGVSPLDETGRATLVLAMAMDTVTAAIAASNVDRVLVAAAEPVELGVLVELGAEVYPDGGMPDLNGSLRHGADVLRSDDPDCVVGALQADLPALRPAELESAVAAVGGTRAFCADRAGTGTTLLLSAPGKPLDPRFGPHSARAHVESGAAAVTLPVPTLRSDVDTAEDLSHARMLGTGRYTSAALLSRRPAC